MADHVSNLPDLSNVYDVPADAARSYREKGHTVLRRVASREEIAAYRPEIESAVQNDSRETGPIEISPPANATPASGRRSRLYSAPSRLATPLVPPARGSLS